MAVQLNSKSLGTLPSNIKKPSYDRDQVKLGVAHIGPGAFFRGHIAVYLDDVLSKGDLNWGISAISLRSPSTRDKLQPQDNLYTVVNQSKDRNEARVIGSIKEVLVAKDDINKVIDRLTSAETKLITLTVTQNGYYYDHKTGQLDFSHPHIKDCLDDSNDSCSTVGLLVKALEIRKNKGLPPPIILSCDNFPGNGNVLRNVVLAYAAMKSEELSEWIRDNVDFPSTMVDRIVPKYAQEHHDQTRDNFGILDNWPIFTESYKEWVIENRFRSDIPKLDDVGAVFTKNVHQHELKKIRLLNGVHLTMGMIGHLAGYKYSHEAIADPEIKNFVKGFFSEVKSTLKSPQKLVLDHYTNTLIKRLANPYMNDELTRLARNSSQKIPTRLISPIRETYAADNKNDHLLFGVATWIKFLKGVDSNGNNFDINDPEAKRMNLPDLAIKGKDDPRGILSVEKLFGIELSGDADFAHQVSQYLTEIEQKGIKVALSEFLQHHTKDNKQDIINKTPPPYSGPSQ